MEGDRRASMTFNMTASLHECLEVEVYGARRERCEARRTLSRQPLP
jgi:hypothetical protein